MCKRILAFFIALFPFIVSAQYQSMLPASKWVDSVYKSLNNDQRIAQLMIVRAHSNLGADHVAKVVNDIKKYNIGSLCFFQGGPVREANLTNYYQKIAQTPLLMTIDGEFGLGMRLDSVTKMPYQLTLGALADTALVYEMGYAIGLQCKRLGIHVNYAPVVDINNNPNNPVIGFRSFGEDKYRVAKLGIAYMKGMQDAGIMACAKHFPGHGDVAVDSHHDLPVINKTLNQLKETELYPFREMIREGVQSVMIAHLSIPSIDNGKNRATSISKNAVTNLLRKEMGFNGLTFTDALEMKGVAKYFPQGTIAVEALIAGNDMLCLPESVPGAITAVKEAIKKSRLSWKDIEEKTKKVLLAKYNLGLNKVTPIDINNITEDINAATENIRLKAAEQSLTLLKLNPATSLAGGEFSLPLNKSQKIAYVAFTNGGKTAMAQQMKDALGADVFYINYKDALGKGGVVAKEVNAGKYDKVVLAFHDVNTRKGSTNFGISETAIKNWYSLNNKNAVTLLFGNPLAVPTFCTAKSLAVCYEDDEAFQTKAVEWLQGKFKATGKLPITVCNWNYGDGIVSTGMQLPAVGDERFAAVDSLALDAIKKKAFPGCVVLAAQNGELVYHKAFGHFTYDTLQPMQLSSVFDVASVTKTSATTLAIMKLYEEGRIDIKKKLSEYLSFVKKTNKASLTLEQILLHQGGMVPFIAFYKETLTADGYLRSDLYRVQPEANFTTPVAQNLYIRNDWKDTIWKRILDSEVTAPDKKYVYSDNDFWFLGKIVETVTGKSLNDYVAETFYRPMQLNSTGFLPLDRMDKNTIVPTELEVGFRNQLLQGTVHDEGAALGGGVAGHAGLFSNAFDLAKLYQMLLNGGTLNFKQYLQLETIQQFTTYQSSISRRAYGFDKPEKDNATRNDPYPSKLASPQTFGHTGFTGTCVWVDPRYNIVYVLLSNRVNPTRNNNKINSLKIRANIQDAIYKALGIV